MARHFIFEDPALIAQMEEWRKTCAGIADKRKEWGATDMLASPDGMNVYALRDPRTFEPPSALPKGWRKVRSHPDYVEPTIAETRKALRELCFPNPVEMSGEILRRIADVDSFNAERIFRDSTERKDLIYWDGTDEEKKLRMYSMGFHAFENMWVVSIPDAKLRYDAIPGFREMKEWEYLKRQDEMYNKKRSA